MEEFMKKIQKEIDKGIVIASVKSKELLDSAKIRTEIWTLQDRKRQGFEEIGRLVYQMSQDKEFPGEAAIKEKCEVLAGLDEKIRTREMELQHLHQQAQEAMGKVICPSCGAAMAEDIKFCSNCGARMVKVEKD